MGFKIPPIEKIHEAYSAIVDERIKMSENEAIVMSSDLSKNYLVTWEENTYKSNDNASYWQGYIGYPVIAILMLQNKLPLNMEIANYFKGINWKKLNTEHKNKYSEVVQQLFDEFRLKGIDCNVINTEIEHVYSKIKELNINIKRSSIRPPR